MLGGVDVTGLHLHTVSKSWVTKVCSVSFDSTKCSDFYHQFFDTIFSPVAQIISIDLSYLKTHNLFDGTSRKRKASVMDYSWLVGDRVDVWMHDW